MRELVLHIFTYIIYHNDNIYVTIFVVIFFFLMNEHQQNEVNVLKGKMDVIKTLKHSDIEKKKKV